MWYIIISQLQILKVLSNLKVYNINFGMRFGVVIGNEK